MQSGRGINVYAPVLPPFSALDTPRITDRWNPAVGSPGDEETLGASSTDLLETGSDATFKALPDLPRLSRLELLWLLIKSSIAWVLLGIAIMLLGIGMVQAAILPLIFTCPSGAACPGTFDPNSTNVLQILQSIMSYWLTVGITVAALGLVKLSAYQSWFIMMSHGDTIENIDLNLGALKGSLFDAGRLFLRRGNRFLSILVLAQIGISSAISILVGLSVSRDFGDKPVTFNYPDVSRLPDSSLKNLNSDGQVEALAKVTAWALSNDTSHGGALRGSLVIPDARSAQTRNSRAGGPRIHGDISCSGYTDYKIKTDGGLPRYDINVTQQTFFGRQDMQLAVSMTHISTASALYLWVSNTSDLIPNATRTSDGALYIALCNHTIDMMTVSQTDSDPSIQYIMPNDVITSGCMSTDTNVCIADSVNNAVLQFWGGIGTAFWKMSCRGGVLGPQKPDRNKVCPLSADLWLGTVTSVLDGIMQTAPTTGLAPQRLVATVQNLSSRRWWIQGIIPLCTLLLYGVGLFYTCLLGQSHTTLKKLSLVEVIGTAQIGQIRNPVHSGQLEKSMMLFGSRVGSARPHSRFSS